MTTVRLFTFFLLRVLSKKYFHHSIENENLQLNSMRERENIKTKQKCKKCEKNAKKEECRPYFSEIQRLSNQQIYKSMCQTHNNE